MKGKECKECGRVGKLWSKGRCYWCSQRGYARKSNEAKRSLPISKPKRSAKVELDLIFGKYVKKRNSTVDGELFCFTSFKLLGIKKIEIGHLFGRGYMRFRWDFKNTFPQSYSHNRFKNGSPEIYEENLIQLYGEDFVTHRRESLNLPFKITKYDIEKQIEVFRNEYRDLEIDQMIGEHTDHGQIMWFDGENHIARKDNNLILV